MDLKGLDKQVNMYSLDTGAFYTDKEKKIQRRINRYNNLVRHLKMTGNDELLNKTKQRIKEAKALLIETIDNNVEIRQLDKASLIEKNVISVFESVLTRTLGIKEDSLTDKIIVVRAYYYQVLKELIKNGFMLDEEKYIYFSSSAGQIRGKKGVWIKEREWDKYKDSLTCGLSVKEINKQGGSNINKYLAYIALTNSASAPFNNFDIRKAIVVNDLETNVIGTVDYIDKTSYEITRKEMEIPIEHTDGAGMILPKRSKKSFMVRLPFVKGLLVPFAFDEFAKECDNTKITDIYNREWDIIEDNIEIIFTKSQFKMWKYYDSWEKYQNNFIEYKCQAAKLNEEESVFPDARLNYQMLQTLTDMTDEELESIARRTIEDIKNIGSNKETMLRVLGATEDNARKNPFQEALYIYPELLNDVHSKEVIKDVKKSLVKSAKCGKLKVSSKYTFICPDMYAFCERLFKGEKNPKGLLKNGEVYCSLFSEEKVDILRSPHLYREHGIKKNIIDDEKAKWFISKGVYTSVHDTISKMLQFDNDGDKVFVVNDPVFVEVAERNMNGIVPLYYEMAVASNQEITKDNIYDGLIKAFKANIGELSNRITKLFNSENPDMDVIKWLCMENNFSIDYAKTLFMPNRPKHIDKRIKECLKGKLPHFFMYAKDKEDHQVEEVNNSVVNRLDHIIPDKRIYFKKVAGELEHKNLMSVKSATCTEEVKNKYEELNRSKKWKMKERKTHSSHYIDTYNKRELEKVELDESKVVDQLVDILYKNGNDRKKKILWDSYGDKLLHNLQKNIKDTKQCEDCGIRMKIKLSKKLCQKCASKRTLINKRKYKTKIKAKK